VDRLALPHLSWLERARDAALAQPWIPKLRLFLLRKMSLIRLGDAQPATNIGASPEEATMARRRVALLALALAFYTVFILRTSLVVLGERWFVLFEDAMISMRYARNLAAGAGLVWNAGETPVEGYTNFLWTLWMAAIHLLGLPESKVSLAMMLTGVAILIGNALLVERICRRVTSAATAGAAPLVAMAVTLFYYPLVFWTLRGMEVGAVALVFDALILLSITMEEEFSPARALAMGVLGAAAILIRSDALVSVGVISLYAALTVPGRKRQLAVAFAVGACVGVAALLQVAFRRGVYHETLPNTYFLKLLHVSLGARLKRGIFVALRVLAFHLAVPLSLLAAALAAWPREAGFWKLRENRRLLLLLAVCGVQVAYAVYVGGDAWEWMLYSNRYVTVAMPAFIVLTTAMGAKMAAVVREDAMLRRRAGNAFILTLAACGACLVVLNGYAHLRPEVGIARTLFLSKSTLLGAAVFLGVAAALFFTRGSVGARLDAAFEALPTSHGFAAGLTLAALVWVPVNVHPFVTWAAHNAAQFDDEARYTRLGALIAATTAKTTRLAVVAAGATPYFSMRPAEDMLGKNDATIAKHAPAGAFSPGHDKWDYHYSLGERHPDIMVELLDVTPEDLSYIASLGFVILPNGLYVRADSTGIDRVILGRPYDTQLELDEDLTLARVAATSPAATTATQ
jgi:hypothetical protein